MKLSSIHNRQPSGLDATMTPMIDVVFLLLVFFLWTASFQTIEYLLPSQMALSGGSSAEPEIPPELIDLEQVVVRLFLASQGVRWTVNDEVLSSLDDIRARLAQVAFVRTDVAVIIDPEAKVLLGDVIDVYDIAMQAGFENIQFTTI